MNKPDVIVYSKPFCSWCGKAKSLISQNGMTFQEVVIGEDISPEDFTSLFPEQKTVPMILINGDPVGGFENLKEWVNNDSSKQLLEG